VYKSHQVFANALEASPTLCVLIMPAVVFYFQLHQPHRLRKFSVFDTEPNYFDEPLNAEICRKVADKCYRPGLQLLLDLIHRHPDRVGFALSVTGTLLDQLQANAPDVINLLRELAATGRCEFLGETYYHSLASLYSPDELTQQVTQHASTLQSLIGAPAPRVVRNTELIYSNDIAAAFGSMKQPPESPPPPVAILTESAPQVVGSNSSGGMYSTTGSTLKVLARNATLSDDVAFRFSNRQWNHWPLTAAKFAHWVVDGAAASGGLVNLFMDFETFGEHQWAQTGIFQFLSSLPDALFTADKSISLVTPSQAVELYQARAAFNTSKPISWADTARDLTPWRGNAMQVHALEELYRLERTLKDRVRWSQQNDQPEQQAQAQQLLTSWRKLTTSDHFYYMSTKGAADGSVHAYFRHFDSPYESYISFMNVLDHLRTRVLALGAPTSLGM